jgi:hypothetical protein
MSLPASFPGTTHEKLTIGINVLCIGYQAEQFQGEHQKEETALFFIRHATSQL